MNILSLSLTVYKAGFVFFVDIETLERSESILGLVLRFILQYTISAAYKH
jgi:hypothetical protein